jgi:trans-aconitate methyltransferase
MTVTQITKNNRNNYTAVCGLNGRRYGLANGVQKALSRPLIAELKLRGDETILDIGCGEGTLTRELADRVPNGRVVGIDASEDMIYAARRWESSNLVFHRMDARYLNAEDAFDVIYSNATLHWIADQYRLFGAVQRALRPGGVFRANFGGAGNTPTLLAVLREVIADPVFAAYFDGFTWPWHMPTERATAERLRTLPFARSRVWAERIDHRFDTADAMVRWLDQPCLAPFVPRIDSELLQRLFRNAVVERMLARTRRADGRFVETFVRINVFAEN